MDAEVSPRIDTATLVKLGPVIRNELRRLALTGAVSAEAALKHVFRGLFGEDRSREDEIRFMVFAAPFARRLAVGMADPKTEVPGTTARVSDVQEWLGWLDVFDPLCARMVDLHYFAKLSTKETAVALNMPVASVIRELRFAKAWLQAKLL